MTNIEKLLNEVNQLKSLLEDPHPGLFTWCEAYYNKLCEISSWYTGKDTPNKSLNSDQKS